MISKGKRRAIITISAIFFGLCIVIGLLIGAQGGPAGGSINIFMLIVSLIGVMQFEVLMFVFVVKIRQSAKPSKMSLRTQLLILGCVGIVFIVSGIVVDALHQPAQGGPYISNLGSFVIIPGCIFLAMTAGTYVREKMFGQVQR